MILLCVIFFINLGSTAAGFWFIYYHYGLQYAASGIMIMILGILHTLILYSMVRAGSSLEENLCKKLHISRNSDGLFVPKTVIVFCGALILSWLINAIVLTELPLFHVEGVSYTGQIPLVMSIANVLGGIVGGMLFYLWLIFNFDMTIL